MILDSDERRVLNAIVNRNEFTWQEHHAACGNDSVKAARARQSLIGSGMIRLSGQELHATDAGLAALPRIKEFS